MFSAKWNTNQAYFNSLCIDFDAVKKFMRPPEKDDKTHLKFQMLCKEASWNTKSLPSAKTSLSHYIVLYIKVLNARLSTYTGEKVSKIKTIYYIGRWCCMH